MQRRRDALRIAVGTRLLCGALLIALPACQRDGTDPHDASDWRAVATLLALVSPAGEAASEIPPLPASLQLRIPPGTLERIDLLALRGCTVQRNINRRDTSLARLATPSQQLLLTLEFLHLAPPCIHRLRRRDPPLAQRLRIAWQQQQSQLPALIFNATLGGDEFRAFWRAAPVAGEYPPVDACDTDAALRAIDAAVQRWLGGDYHADDREFEVWLAAVAGGAGNKDRNPVAGLEAQLADILPSDYRRWMADRDAVVSAIATSPRRQHPRVCATQ